MNAFAKNASLYQHHLSQNTAIRMNRELEVDNYFNLNLKDADFVFNADKTEPVIQFYHQLEYNYTLPPPSTKAADKKTEAEKVFYIIDKNGNMKKVEM